MKTLAEVLQSGKCILSGNNIEEAEIDAWYLMEYVFHISRVDYLLESNKEINEIDYEKYIACIEQRAKHIPLQHIIGVTEFMGLEFFVNENVLIPRQDTECLVEEVMKVASHKSVLDMCTGSGCIITSLSKLCNLKEAVGVDISEKALEVAKKNIEKHSVNVELIESNLFDKIERRFDIIVSNPPYIKSHIIENLMPEVREHEPILALDGMEDGLYFYKKIIKDAKDYLTEHGMIFFEIGHDQGREVKDLLEASNFSSIKIIKDLAGLDRVVIGSR